MAVGGSAPRKALGGAGTSSASASSPSAKGNKSVGGNSYCPRPTPEWQKGISSFLSPGKSKDKENSEPNGDIEIVDDCQAGSSSSSSEASSSQGSSKSSSDDD